MKHPRYMYLQCHYTALNATNKNMTCQCGHNLVFHVNVGKNVNSQQQPVMREVIKFI